MQRKSIPVLLLVILIGLLSSACRKDPPLLKDPFAKLKFSADTVLFDTVFTTVGSITKQLKVYNPFNSKILIDNILLAGGDNSQFRLNIDGIAGNYAREVEIMPGDSLYIFVEVTVNPQNSNAPLVVSDSILFDWNGKIQHVDLVAWGQDANYIRADRFIQGFPGFSIVADSNKTVTWTKDKPYVIYGYAAVDSTGKLVIEAGTKVYFHKNSGMWIYRYGELEVNGTQTEPVQFQGDRLDYEYRYIPGQWDRIWINEGAKSKINYAIIRNGFIGIQAETILGRQAGDQTELVISNTQISSMAGYGLYAVYHNIRASNLLVTECKEHSLAILLGGSYSFRHCTFANYWQDGQRKSPSVIINNYNDAQTIPLDTALFGNCIITGNYENELALDLKSGSSFNYLFDHCLLKTDATTPTTDPTRFVSITPNPADILVGGTLENALFKDYRLNDYHLKTASAASGKGNPVYGFEIPLDLDGKTRLNPPDLGCYEE